MMYAKQKISDAVRIQAYALATTAPVMTDILATRPRTNL